MTALTYRIAILLAAVAVFIGGTQSHAAPTWTTEVRTLNFDFGNAGAYVGDNGVLSAPGGTHWNEVTVTSFPQGSGISTQFGIPPLRDEFGRRFGLGIPFGGGHPNPLPELMPGSHTGHEISSPAPAPLNDGVSLGPSGGFFGFSIRELTSAVPIELVVYFNYPDPSSQPVNTVSVNTIFGGGGDTKSTSSSGFPPGLFFPGLEGIDYLRFSNLSPIPTTLGDPALPGVIIQVPQGGVANIAAIQIRGEFVFVTPEPGSLAMTLSAGYFVRVIRRRKALA